jgi:hypothetical protein
MKHCSEKRKSLGWFSKNLEKILKRGFPSPQDRELHVFDPSNNGGYCV